MSYIPIITEDFSIPIMGGLIFFVIIVFVIIIPIVLLRWIFRINEQIELLDQIRNELRKLRLHKYPEKREDENAT